MPENSRKRQVETMKQRYGLDIYSRIGAQRSGGPLQAKWASWRRWKPDRFDSEGNLLPQYEKEFYRDSNGKDK